MDDLQDMCTTSSAAQPVSVSAFDGSRTALRFLFELAEDSALQLDSYIDMGEMLVALDGAQVIGHVQITAPGTDGELEIKNMAVIPSQQRRGIGRQLVAAALDLARSRHCRTVRVSTAAADTENLRFYQRCGFRMQSIEHDAFGPAQGYPEGALSDGIELRDRVWLAIELEP